MTALQSFARFVWRVAHSGQPPGPQASPAVRRFAAAKIDRLTADWLAGNLSANAELRMDLKTLRNRSRELAANNHFFKKWFRSLQRNVIGPAGIRCKSMATRPDGRPDAVARQIITEEFADWGECGVCTVDGQLSWKDVQRLVLKAIAQDGDLIIRHIRGADAGNRWGYAVQLMESDHLAESYEARSVGAENTVFMGVETNRFKRPVAYHLTGYHPGDDLSAMRTARTIVVPARDLIVPFIVDRPGQTRGVPWGHAAMLRLNDLGRYEEAEIVATRAASAKMGFIKTVTGEGYVGDDETDDGDVISEFSPGMIEQLPVNTEFQPFDPQHPASAYEPFSRAMLHGIAAGLDTSYSEITGDLSKANFSNMRQGALSDRDAWRAIQTWITDRVLKVIRTEWLTMALTTQAVPLPMARFDAFNRAKWQPRGWSWVDPAKEVKAHADAIALKTESRTNVAAQSGGRDIEEIFAEIAEEAELAASMGVDLSPPTPAAPVPGPPSDDDDDDDDEDDEDDDNEGDDDA